ncbi:MAG TPA: AMP-binding protein, partial [Acidimicrobiales bacterium]
MTLTYDEAVAKVTAPGELFETTQAQVGGVTYTVFKHAPGSVRDLLGLARMRGDETFLVYEDERWSFAEVMHHVDALASTLVDHYCIAKGDRVSIGMRNYPEWVISYAAILSVGAIAVSLNAWWTEDELNYALADSGSSLLIADDERAERAAKLGVPILGVRGAASGDRW